MKKFATVFIIMLSIVSCSSDDATSKNALGYYGKWKLTTYTTSFVLAIYIPGEPQWQEYYDFKTDNTFLKTRIINGITTTASGTFLATKNNDQTNLKLTYSETSDIIGSCLGNLTEELILDNRGVLFSTWRNCDGPGFEYKKVR